MPETKPTPRGSELQTMILNKAGGWLTVMGVSLVVLGVLTMMEPAPPVRGN